MLLVRDGKSIRAQEAREGIKYNYLKCASTRPKFNFEILAKNNSLSIIQSPYFQNGNNWDCKVSQ